MAIARADESLTLPVGPWRVGLPNVQHLAFYGALGALVAVEIIEWPVAVVLGLGKALADQHRNRALAEFGKALDEIA